MQIDIKRASSQKQPHFHAKYGSHEGVIGLNPVRAIKGNLPPRVLGLVIEWATLYSVELNNTWNALKKEIQSQRSLQ